MSSNPMHEQQMPSTTNQCRARPTNAKQWHSVQFQPVPRTANQCQASPGNANHDNECQTMACTTTQFQAVPDMYNQRQTMPSETIQCRAHASTTKNCKARPRNAQQMPSDPAQWRAMPIQLPTPPHTPPPHRGHHTRATTWRLGGTPPPECWGAWGTRTAPPPSPRGREVAPRP